MKYIKCGLITLQMIFAQCLAMEQNFPQIGLEVDSRFLEDIQEISNLIPPMNLMGNEHKIIQLFDGLVCRSEDGFLVSMSSYLRDYPDSERYSIIELALFHSQRLREQWKREEFIHLMRIFEESKRAKVAPKIIEFLDKHGEKGSSRIAFHSDFFRGNKDIFESSFLNAIPIFEKVPEKGYNTLINLFTLIPVNEQKETEAVFFNILKQLPINCHELTEFYRSLRKIHINQRAKILCYFSPLLTQAENGGQIVGFFNCFHELPEIPNLYCDQHRQLALTNIKEIEFNNLATFLKIITAIPFDKQKENIKDIIYLSKNLILNDQDYPGWKILSKLPRDERLSIIKLANSFDKHSLEKLGSRNYINKVIDILSNMTADDRDDCVKCVQLESFANKINSCVNTHNHLEIISLIPKNRRTSTFDALHQFLKDFLHVETFITILKDIPKFDRSLVLKVSAMKNKIHPTEFSTTWLSFYSKLEGIESLFQKYYMVMSEISTNHLIEDITGYIFGYLLHLSYDINLENPEIRIKKLLENKKPQKPRAVLSNQPITIQSTSFFQENYLPIGTIGVTLGICWYIYNGYRK